MGKPSKTLQIKILKHELNKVRCQLAEAEGREDRLRAALLTIRVVSEYNDAIKFIIDSAMEDVVDKIQEENAEPFLGCFGCGLEYGGDHWLEIVLPNDIWAKISPTGDDGGILCANCIAERLNKLGMKNVSYKLVAGPLAITQANWILSEYGQVVEAVNDQN